MVISNRLKLKSKKKWNDRDWWMVINICYRFLNFYLNSNFINIGAVHSTVASSATSTNKGLVNLDPSIFLVLSISHWVLFFSYWLVSIWTLKSLEKNYTLLFWKSYWWLLSEPVLDLPLLVSCLGNPFFIHGAIGNLIVNCILISFLFP